VPHPAKPDSTPPVERITQTVTRTVRDIVEVLPGWAKALMAALGCMLLLAAFLIVRGVLRNRRLRRQRAALLEEVGALQDAVLPAVPDRVGALAVSVAYRPVHGLAAGGDFYDVFPLERGRVGIILGDVSGHGPDSLSPANFVRHMVRSYMEAGMTPRAAIQLTGNVLDDQKRDDFATIVAALHDPAAGTLSYATAGHPPPIVSGPTWHEPLVVASSPPAGAGTTTGLRQTTVALPTGSAVWFFTDGLSEARTGAAVFGRDRLERAVHELGAEATAQDLVDRVERTTDRLADDVAVLLIRADEGGSAEWDRVEEIEVTLSDLHTPRLRSFLEACGVEPDQAEAAMTATAPFVSGYGSVLLRVRMADGCATVDVVPVETATPDPDLADVRRTR
jgi:serine phosphatase RsbU (regulator of sigma subunit)